MATVQLRPGDTLNILVHGLITTVIGNLESSAVVPFTYDDLMELLSKEKKPGTSRKSKTPGAKASRQISLLVNAWNKGVWSTGAPVRRFDVGNKLVTVLNDLLLEKEGDCTLTPKARDSLHSLQATDPKGLGPILGEIIVTALLAKHL